MRVCWLDCHTVTRRGNDHTTVSTASQGRGCICWVPNPNSLGFMNKVLVWDIPTRVFHWAFAASLTGALGIGLLVDDDSPLFQWHMLLGIAAAFLLVARLVLGLIGSRYARFSSFPLHPLELAGYLISALLSKTRRYAGNNPGSAAAAVLMFVLVPALFATGAGWAEGDLHEALAWASGDHCTAPDGAGVAHTETQGEHRDGYDFRQKDRTPRRCDPFI